jgi:hypothetical protein
MINWIGCGRKLLWPNFKVLYHLPGWTKENQENTSQSSKCVGQDFNQGPPENKAGVLTARP